MKQFITCTMLLLMTISSFCQQTNSSQSLTQQGYLQKSKKQKTTAWVLLGGGAAVAVGAAILDVSSDWSKSEDPYLVAMSAGCASMLGSIPFFIASKRNKRKAMNASAYLNIRQNTLATNAGLTLHATPTLSLKFNFL
jgi:hypothetical protein